MMARKKEEYDPIKERVRTYLGFALIWIAPYVITYVLMAVLVAYIAFKASPQAFAIIVTLLVAIGVAAIAGVFYVLYKWRRFQHWIIARRADKQNAAYL